MSERMAASQQDILKIVIETAITMINHHQMKSYGMHRGAEETIRETFKIYCDPKDSQWGEYANRAVGSRLLAIYTAMSNWDKVQDRVVEEFKPLNPFAHDRMRVGMAFLQWLKVIIPIIQDDLPDLTGDKLDEAWQQMKAQWAIIATEAGCFEET